jgi:hypothetical protein
MFSAGRVRTPQKPSNTMPLSDFDNDTHSTSDNEREELVQEVVRYLLRNELGKLERAETREIRKRQRALHRRRERRTMFEDRTYANAQLTRLLRGHPEKLRTTTRLNLYQFETLSKWLDENTDLDSSRFTNINTKITIFLYICGHGVLFRAASLF